MGRLLDSQREAQSRWMSYVFPDIQHKAHLKKKNPGSYIWKIKKKLSEKKWVK